MSKIFAVHIEAADDEAPASVSRNQRQRAWFVRMAEEGKLLACGPHVPGGALWLLRAATRDEATKLVATCPHHQEGALPLERARIQEWTVSIGKERFL
jgi:uncharacterized protein YciI